MKIFADLQHKRPFFTSGGYQAKSLLSQEKTPFVLSTLISFIKESIDFVYRFD